MVSSVLYDKEVGRYVVYKDDNGCQTKNSDAIIGEISVDNPETSALEEFSVSISSEGDYVASGSPLDIYKDEFSVDRIRVYKITIFCDH